MRSRDRSWCLRLPLGVLLLVPGGPVLAGEQPLYQPAPDWIAPLPQGGITAPALGPISGSPAPKGPSLLVLDQQVRLDHGKVWSYFDKVVHVDTPEALTQLGTLAASWSPGKGDFIVHRAVIERSGQSIDLLGAGRFTVLRREARLEQRVLDGTLTATMPVSGLEVGDTLRFTFSVTDEDSVLAGREQAVRSLPAAPASVGFARLRVSWPDGDAVRWRVTPEASDPAHPRPLPVARRQGHDWVLDLPLPLPKPAPIPADAPSRYRHAPLFQVGNFASWTDVSRIMAPLFATDGAIAPGSAVATEVATIMAASSDPRIRAARALELVQSRISYLLLGMNNGNYVPQPVAETWARRFGDCKAKTLLLLAMLRAMGIEAEPVLATLQGGDALPTLLPMAGAFDHVLVHAVIGGEDLWLDGTGLSSRLDDLDDVPPLGFVLPLRKGGAELMPLVWRRPHRPESRVTIAMDESAGIDLPALVDVTMTLKGAGGAGLALGAGQVTREQRDEITRRAVRTLFPDFNLIESALSANGAEGTATLRAKGLVTGLWGYERAGARQSLDFVRNEARFNPDRARAAWRDIPVSLGGAGSLDLHVALTLPEGGRGYRLEGDSDFAGIVAGRPIERKVTIEGALVTLDARIASPAEGEVPASEVSGAKSAAARFLARLPLLRAPVGARRFWQVREGGRTRLAALDEAFAAAIAAKPDEAALYADRARFRRRTFDRTGAYADLAKALDLEPTVRLHAERSDMFEEDGRYAEALADMQAAQDIEPANHAVAARRAHLLVRLGRRKEALALRQEELDNAGPDRADVITQFGEVLAETGQAETALADLDKAALERPGNRAILNLRCWIEGTRQVALAGALKDCTRAIELADEPVAALDSRALVYFRLGRFEEALADLDAALDAAPGIAGSLFMRAVIEGRLGRHDAALEDLASARAIRPSIVRDYGEYGIAAPVAGASDPGARP